MPLRSARSSPHNTTKHTHVVGFRGNDILPSKVVLKVVSSKLIIQNDTINNNIYDMVGWKCIFGLGAF